MQTPMTERAISLVGLCTGLLVLLGLTLYAFDRKGQQGQQREIVREMRSVIEEIQGIHVHLLEAESGQRGFVLTQDVQYLVPYQAAVEQIPPLLVALDQRTKQDLPQHKHTDTLRLLIDKKLLEIRTTLDLAQTSPAEAIQFVQSNAGKLLMDDIRVNLSALLAEEYEFMRMVDQQEKRAAGQAYQAIAWGSVLALVLLGLGTYRVIRDSEIKEQADRLFEQNRLLDLAPIMTRTLDGRILSWSKGCEGLYGWTKEAALGQITHQLLQTQFSPRLDEIQNILLRDGQWNGELTHTRQDGQTIPISANWTLLKDRAGRPTTIVEVNTNISDLQAAEIAKVRSEARFQLLADNMSQFAWIADQKGWIQWYNQRWFDYTGTTLQEMEGWGWKKVHHPEHVDRVVEKISRCFETGEVWEDTFPLRGRDGTYRWFLSRAIPIRGSQGQIVQWFGTHTDITDRYQAEQALTEHTTFTQSILDSLQLHIAVIDVRGVILHVNRSWTGFAQENLGACLPEAIGVGVNYLEAVRPAAASDTAVRQAVEGIKAVLAGTLDVFEQEYPCHAPTQRRWFRMSVFPLQGEAAGAVVSHLNITARKLAEEAQAFLAAIVAGSTDAILSKSLQGTILTWNHGAEVLFGYDEKEIVGRAIDQLIPDELRDEERSMRSRVLLGTHVEQFETQRLHKEGRRIDVSISMSPILNESGTVIATAQTMRDITIRKRIETNLRQSEQFQRALFESSPDCVKVLSTEGKLLLMNANGLCAMDMDSFEPYCGKRWAEFWPMELRSLIQEALDTADQGSVSHFQGECHTAQGRRRWWDVTVTAVNDSSGRFLVVSRDITHQRQAEMALRASEERFRALATNIPQLVWSCQPDGVCTYLSEQWLSFTGTTLEQNLGYGWLALIHPDDALMVDRVWKESVASGSPYSVEYRLKAADGSYRWQLARATPQRDKEGTICSWFGTTTDISTQKANEAMLERVNALLESKREDLAAANKELEAFSYSVSHDLRAPLRTMMGFAQALLEDYGDKLEPEAARYLTTISNSARQMGRLIDGLLSFSRLSRQNLSIQSVALPELVSEIQVELAAEQRGRTIEWDISELPTCRGDRTTIKMVLANLLGNALKYTRPRDVAKIAVGWQADNQQSSCCRIFVKDNGVGFDMRYAEKLFTVFQRLHRAEEFEGTGVGLAIVQRIVHRHGGRVWADGQPNEGATFWFTLELSS